VPALVFCGVAWYTGSNISVEPAVFTKNTVYELYPANCSGVLYVPQSASMNSNDLFASPVLTFIPGIFTFNFNNN
jgi:hypothetical protein